MQSLRKIFFKEFITLQRGFDLPKAEMLEGPYPVVGSTSIIGYHNEYKVSPPGIVMGRSGSLGQIQYINNNFWPHNTSLWVKDFKANFPKYVYGTGCSDLATTARRCVPKENTECFSRRPIGDISRFYHFLAILQSYRDRNGEIDLIPPSINGTAYW